MSEKTRTASIDEIAQQVLALPPADRTVVMAALESSLSSGETTPASAAAEQMRAGELLAELERRSAAYKSGAMPARPAADVIAELRRAL